MQKEYNLLNEKVHKLHTDLEDQIHVNTQLLAENSQRHMELHSKDEQIAHIQVFSLRCAVTCVTGCCPAVPCRHAAR
jgi:hypothetical protein